MKKMFDFVSFLGFFMILGGAGGYETMSCSFGKSFIIMLFGSVLFGTSLYCKEKYRKYLRRCACIARKKKMLSRISNEKICMEMA